VIGGIFLNSRVHPAAALVGEPLTDNHAVFARLVPRHGAIENVCFGVVRLANVNSPRTLHALVLSSSRDEAAFIKVPNPLGIIVGHAHGFVSFASS
jgi:hypothetical protein